jgi:hypothetical protein
MNATPRTDALQGVPMTRKDSDDFARQLERELNAATRQVSMIEDFLWGRKYCTELYISPLGFDGGESWQVELNWGDGTTASFQGASVAEALSAAMVAAMQRKKI